MICNTCGKNEAINDYYKECQGCIEKFRIMRKTNKDVLSIKVKDEFRILTKILRVYAKTYDTNQFKMSLKFMSLFYKTIGLYDTFVEGEGLIGKFHDYAISLNGGYEDMFQIIKDFAEAFNSLMVPEFGV